MFRHLLRPLSYLSIEHKQKWIVDWVYPLIFAVLSTALLFGLKKYGNIPLYADGAVIAKILGFVQGLPGFYIAALAAIATFKEKAEDLLAKPEFEAAVTNPVFKEFWARFTNNNLSDKEAIKYNEAKFVDELIAFCEEAIEGDYRKADVKTADLKTDKGRMTKRNKLYDKSLEDLQSSLDFIDQNEDILKEIVSATNACVDVKMQIVDALDKLDPGYKTFYLDQEQNYIPANGEGYAMSDTDGNVVKLVNRATF